MIFPSERKIPKDDATSVVTVDLSPDGTLLVSGAADGEVALWDVASLTKSRVLIKGRAEINNVKFSPDGTMVASTNDQNELSLVRIGAQQKTGFFKKFFGGSSKTDGTAHGWLDISFSADGRRIATAAKESIVNIIDGNTFVPVKSLRGDKVVALSPKGDLLATANFVQTMTKDYMEVVAVSVETGTGRALTRKESWVNCLAFSPDGKYLACGLKEGMGLGDRSHRVAVWMLPEYDRLSQDLKHDRGELMDYIIDLTFTPSGAHMLSACVDGTVAVWRVNNFDRVQTLAWQDAELTCVAATDACIAAVAKGKGFSIWG